MNATPMSPPPPRAYKGFQVRMGVFAIRHLPSGRVLLDWSPHLEGAFNRNRFLLQTGKHPLAKLQKDWQRDGEAAFVFEVIDELPPDPALPGTHDYREDLKGLEALWRDRLAGKPELSYGPPHA